jgi:hypothetical protein
MSGLRDRVLLAASALAGAAVEVAPARAGDLQLDTSSFLYARYATSSASNLYAAYGFGKAGIVFGMVENPRSGYRELVMGALSRLTWRGQALTVAVAAADASDGTYLQTYLVPSLARGSVSLSGTIEWYQPLGSGTRQLDVNPVTILIRLGPRLSAGAFYALGFAEGAAPRQRAGPALQVALPPGALKLEVVRNVSHSANEVRVVFQASL